jgi:hypothetical protein
MVGRVRARPEIHGDVAPGLRQAAHARPSPYAALLDRSEHRRAARPDEAAMDRCGTGMPSS